MACFSSGSISPKVIERPTGMKIRSEEHTSELQSQSNLVCRLLLEKKKNRTVDTRLRCIKRNLNGSNIYSLCDTRSLPRTRRDADVRLCRTMSRLRNHQLVHSYLSH